MILESCMPSPSVWDTEFEALAARNPGHRFLYGSRTASPDRASVDALVAMRIPEPLLEACTELKAVFAPFAGIDQLPVAVLASRGIRIFNVHSNAFEVAERALAMTLALLGRIVEYHNDLRSGLWHGVWVGRGAADAWTSLRNMKCTILGTGAIGTALARLLGPFGCQVVGFRKNSDKSIPSGFSRVTTEIQDAVAGAGLVVCTLPLTGLTRGIVSGDVFARMSGAVFVNVGRGPVADEEALYESLRSGILAGAALDTWYTYPETGRTGSPSRFPIHALPNVLLSPHVGGSSTTAMSRAVTDTVSNIESWVRTGAAYSEADPGAAY